MRAIILAAGRGSRLLPWTQDQPKCLLAVRGEMTVLELQLRTLASCGVRDACVVTGFGAEQVDEFVRANPLAGIRVRTLFNPFFEAADNLVSCWMAAGEMDDEFLLLNGDTLFEPGALERLLAAPPAPLVVAVHRKAAYDGDDMKVSIRGHRLLDVGKGLDPIRVDGESIGLMRFDADGSRRFRNIVDHCLREPQGLAAWYLTAVARLARWGRVEACDVTGCWWQEIDDLADLEQARSALGCGAAVSGLRKKQRTRTIGTARLRAVAFALVIAVLTIGAQPAHADGLEPSVAGGHDPWLYGPRLRLLPIEGPWRPFVFGSVGRMSEFKRLGIVDPTQPVRDAPLGWRAGAGFELGLSERSALALEGAYLGSQGEGAGPEPSPAGTVGLEFRIDF